MRITKEMFDKLSDKDKKEYTEKKNEIHFNFTLGLTYIRWCIYLLGFEFIAIPLWKMAFNTDVFLALFKLFISLDKVSVYVIVIGFLIDYLIILLDIIRIEKLKKEYFTIEVKAKNEKRK